MLQDRLSLSERRACQIAGQHRSTRRAGASYIEPSSPWQNPFVESFGARVRDELLSQEVLGTLAEAEVLVED